MSVSTQWDNDDRTVVRCTYTGKIAWEDFYRVETELKALLDSTSGPIPIIAELQPPVSLPTNILGHHTDSSQSSMLTHPNAGQVVVVGTNRFIKTVFDIFSRVYSGMNGKIIFANTLEQARALLAEMGQRDDI